MKLYTKVTWNEAKKFIVIENTCETNTPRTGEALNSVSFFITSKQQTQEIIDRLTELMGNF